MDRQIRNQGKCRLDLLTGEHFLGFISQLLANQQNKLLEFATDGDCSTQACPHCGIKMVRYSSRQMVMSSGIVGTIRVAIKFYISFL